MLINLTNHPLHSWNKEQKKTATDLFGEVVDMPFPKIDPLATEVQIQELAQQYLQKIEQTTIQSITVHLMGELCFCFALTQLLRQRGIRVVASTTERIVEEKENGEKIVKFQFVRFREYL